MRTIKEIGPSGSRAMGQFKRTKISKSVASTVKSVRFWKTLGVG